MHQPSSLEGTLIMYPRIRTVLYRKTAQKNALPNEMLKLF